MQTKGIELATFCTKPQNPYVQVLPLCQEGGEENLTIKGEVTKQGGEQVHDEHGHDGDVGHTLHSLLGGTRVMSSKKERKKKTTSC